MQRTYTMNVAFPNRSSSQVWNLCNEPDCPGASVSSFGRCYLHLLRSERTTYLDEIARGAAPLILSGLRIDSDTFREILSALPETEDNPSGSRRPVVLTRADFNETIFTEFVDAQHLTFKDQCSFAKARFEKGAIWNGTTFDAGLRMEQTVFLGDANLSNLHITGYANCAGLATDALLILTQSVVTVDLDLSYAKCGGLWLSYARIGGNLSMREACFRQTETAPEPKPGLVRLDGAVIEGDVDSTGTSFPHETTFGGYADMRPAVFNGNVTLHGCTFGSAKFGGRHLLSRLSPKTLDLTDATFYGRIALSNCEFGELFRMSGLRVVHPSGNFPSDDNESLFPLHELDMQEMTFRGGAELADVEVQGSARISLSHESMQRLSCRDLSVSQALEISDTTFEYYAPMDLSAGVLRFTRCSFTRGGYISCAPSTNVLFSRCDATQPLTIASAVPGGATVISLAVTNVEHFVISDFDLSGTIFKSAVNLDKVRIEGALRLRRAPTLLGRGRQVIADEVAIQKSRGRWSAIETGEDSYSLATTVASLYRSLRKNREDSRDEPGGADFYYGEMEMRRLSAPWSSADRVLLSLYWLIAGYALRSWRAFACLLVCLMASGAIFHFFGLNSGVGRLGFVDSILMVARAFLGLADLPQHISKIGTIIIIISRVLCPALLALAVLSLRGRIKR